MELSAIKDYLMNYLPDLGFKLYDYKVSKQGNTYVLHIVVDRRNYIDLKEISALANNISESLSKCVKEDFIVDCASAGILKNIPLDEINDYLNEKISISLSQAINKMDKIEGILENVNNEALHVIVNFSGKKKSIEVKKAFIAHINLTI